jgi:hypothetical protein
VHVVDISLDSLVSLVISTKTFYLFSQLDVFKPVVYIGYVFERRGVQQQHLLLLAQRRSPVT